MFMPPRNNYDNEKKDEFSKPVESIMRCEDFKSNFARRLSNRYTSKSPVLGHKQDTSMKLRPLDGNPETTAIVPEQTEQYFELSKVIKIEQNCEIVKPPDKTMAKNEELKSTEVTALNMEVETLRWQLAQTEANRQMHLSLLKQIVSFLNRVQEHMVHQNQYHETVARKEEHSSRILPRSFNAADLPRSRSVLHVSRNVEYSLSPSKKLSTKKISKSISNVNGFSDAIWNESKLSLNQESDTGQKIAEEITRLTTLANTVLSTKIPDLSYSFSRSVNNTQVQINDSISPDTNTDEINDSNLNRLEHLVEEDIGNILVLNSNCDDTNIYEEVPDVTKDEKESNNGDFVSSTMISHSFTSDSITLADPPSSPERVIISNEPKTIAVKREYNVPNFIEDESGFSSMSSFQEIGIPIINIIPPTPCKDVGYSLKDLDLLDRDEKWKTTLDLENQTVQVFWV